MKSFWIIRLAAVLAVAVLAWLALGPSMTRGQSQTSTDVSKLLGDWSGESLCAGNLPSCHDEKVIYHFSKSAAGDNKLKLAADKIVDGKPEPMGELEFRYDAAKEILISEFQSPRYHGRWEFAVKGNTMTGTLVLLPDKTVVRRASVKKVDSPQKEPKMNHANGTFEVKLTPQDDKTGGATLGRMTFEKTWHGDLEGTSKGQMLTGGDVTKGSAGYVAMEKFNGTLNGQKGTFIFQHSTTMTRGEGKLTVTVVPDSGTEELAGLSGSMTIKIESGKHFYEFQYTVSK